MQFHQHGLTQMLAPGPTWLQSWAVHPLGAHSSLCSHSLTWESHLIKSPPELQCSWQCALGAPLWGTRILPEVRLSESLELDLNLSLALCCSSYLLPIPTIPGGPRSPCLLPPGISSGKHPRGRCILHTASSDHSATVQGSVQGWVQGWGQMWSAEAEGSRLCPSTTHLVTALVPGLLGLNIGQVHRLTSP